MCLSRLEVADYIQGDKVDAVDIGTSMVGAGALARDVTAAYLVVAIAVQDGDRHILDQFVVESQGFGIDAEIAAVDQQLRIVGQHCLETGSETLARVGTLAEVDVGEVDEFHMQTPVSDRGGKHFGAGHVQAHGDFAALQ